MSRFNGNGNIGPIFPGAYGARFGGDGQSSSALVDRMPPHNLDAERSVLGACLLDESAVATTVAVLRPDDFFREDHATFYRAILILHANGGGIDAVTVADELISQGVYHQIGGDDLLGEIANSVAHAINAPHHAAIVKQKSDSRKLIQLGAEVMERGYSNQFTSVQQMDFAWRGFNLIQEGAAHVEDELSIREFPAELGRKAYHGPIGDMVRVIEPHTEASPAAILTQLLTSFGNLVGHGPHWVHEATRHHMNLFTCIVGNTATGRKGTSWAYVPEILGQVDEDWRGRIVSGVNSGESLIEQVADEGQQRGGTRSLRGVEDKRLLLLETEFARILAIFTRQGDSLSVVLRQFWETGDNAALSRNNPVTCTGAHVSMVAHIPPKELNSRLSLMDVANGLGNRFIWIWSMQSKELERSNTFRLKMVHSHVTDLMAASIHAREVIGVDSAPMGRSETAQELWRASLPTLREPRPGMLGEMLSRAPAQVMRMAAIYALADRSAWINADHLEAALEVWNYSVRSVDFIFGDRLGDKEAEELLTALRAAGPGGITQSDVMVKVFKKHKSKAKLEDLLTRMVQTGLIHKEQSEWVKKSGKPVTTWRLGARRPQPPPPEICEFPNLAGN